MIERDVGDHRHRSVGDVRRVEAAAQSDLEHERLRIRVGECHEPERGEQLEVRGRRRKVGDREVELGGEADGEVGELGLGDRRRVNCDALGDELEVR